MKPLTDEMKNYIQYGTEERRWEFKPPMSWSNNQKKKKYEISKAMFALSNTINGGFIVLGISQKRDRSDGTEFERKGLSTRQFNTFNNEDDIGRFLSGKTNKEIKFEIYGDIVSIDNCDKKFVVIQIDECQDSMPVVCNSDFNTPDRHCRIEKGTLYIRSILNPIESRTIRTNEEWEELIRRLLSRKEEIIYKDLKMLCNVMQPSGKTSVRKESKEEKRSTEYDKFLKRDKL